VIEQLTVENHALADETPILVKMQEKGAAAPLFCVHPVGGHVFCYADLAEALGEEQPFYALQAPSQAQIVESLATIGEIANLYLQEIRKVHPHGPYFLGGWSVGGVIAWQMARQVRLEGEAVGMLALIDTNLPLKNRSGDKTEGFLCLPHSRWTYTNCWARTTGKLPNSFWGAMNVASTK
jgi:thioesterase domain-containing protein